jgi:DNA mismatch endonuclease (patch repair protein)
MRNIRSTNTKIEIKVRSVLHKKGFRFRKNVNEIIGKPDIVLPKYNIVIFIDSCFWHCCPYHGNIPTSNKSYWIPKLRRNKERAKEVNSKLKNEGWKVIRIWEHQINSNFNKTITRIEQQIKNNY